MGYTFNAELFANRFTLKQRAMYLSVRQTAKEIGISPATVSRLNRDKFIPDVNTYYKCCKWLELQMDYFFTVPKPTP